MVSSTLFESRSEEYGTPPGLFRFLDGLFHFTLDPCASVHNHKCQRYYTKQDDGLSQPWENEIVFMNPPYGREIGRWMEKAVLSARQHNCTVVCLVHARTDTQWWHKWAVQANEIWFIEGRLKFEGGRFSSTFPSVVIVFRPYVEEVKVRFLRKESIR